MPGTFEVSTGEAAPLRDMSSDESKELQSVLLIIALAEVYSQSAHDQNKLDEEMEKALTRLIVFVDRAPHDGDVPPRLKAILSSAYIAPFKLDMTLRKNLAIVSGGSPMTGTKAYRKALQVRRDIIKATAELNKLLTSDGCLPSGKTWEQLLEQLLNVMYWNSNKTKKSSMWDYPPRPANKKKWRPNGTFWLSLCCLSTPAPSTIHFPPVEFFDNLISQSGPADSVEGEEEDNAAVASTRVSLSRRG